MLLLLARIFDISIESFPLIMLSPLLSQIIERTNVLLKMYDLGVLNFHLLPTLIQQIFSSSPFISIINQNIMLAKNV